MILENLKVAVPIPSGFSHLSIGICIEKEGRAYYAWCPTLNIAAQARSLKSARALLRGKIASRLSQKVIDNPEAPLAC